MPTIGRDSPTVVIRKIEPSSSERIGRDIYLERVFVLALKWLKVSGHPYSGTLSTREIAFNFGRIS